MESAKASLLEQFHLKTCFPAEVSDFIFAVYVYITVTLKIDKRYLYTVAEPPYGFAVHCHIAEDEPSAGLQNAVCTVEEILYIRIVMEALAAYDRIERIIPERQILTIADNKHRSRYVLGLCHLDHFRSEIDTRVVLVGVFGMQERYHGSRAAPAVKETVKRFLLKFSEHVRIVFLAHLVHACLVSLVDTRGLREFLDR